MHLRAALTIACACLALAASPAQAADCKSTVSGDLRIHQLASKIFNNTRSIRVLLPPGYDAAENRSKRYPVLYMLDGQNLFDACLSDVSHVEWQLDETVYRLIREKAIPEMIVVGVDHAGVKRAYEFLPYRDTSPLAHDSLADAGPVARLRGSVRQEGCVRRVGHWLRFDFCARRIQSGRAPRSAAPDHAPRPQENRPCQQIAMS